MAILIAFLLLGGSLVPAPVPIEGCHGLTMPPARLVVRPYAPVGRWAGHWGIDVASTIGGVVTPVGPGTVAFSGVVVGNHTVTIDHGGGVVTSYSYLGSIDVGRGVAVGRSTRLGTSTIHDGVPSYHLSLRLNGTYVDPAALARCWRGTSTALYLTLPVVSTRPYPAVRARTPRRNLRSTTHRPPRGRTCRPRAARCGGRSVRPRWRSLAEAA